MGDLPGSVFLYDIQGVLPDGRPTLHRSKLISLRSTPIVYYLQSIQEKQHGTRFVARGIVDHLRQEQCQRIEKAPVIDLKVLERAQRHGRCDGFLWFLHHSSATAVLDRQQARRAVIELPWSA